MREAFRFLNANRPETRQDSPARLVVAFARREPMVVAAVVLFAAFALTSPVFGSVGNAENILRQTAPVLLLGLGMTFVVLVGGIDLSVGSIVLASAVSAGISLVSGLPSSVARCLSRFVAKTLT